MVIVILLHKSCNCHGWG